MSTTNQQQQQSVLFKTPVRSSPPFPLDMGDSDEREGGATGGTAPCTPDSSSVAAVSEVSQSSSSTNLLCGDPEQDFDFSAVFEDDFMPAALSFEDDGEAEVMWGRVVKRGKSAEEDFPTFVWEEREEEEDERDAVCLFDQYYENALSLISPDFDDELLLEFAHL